MFPSTPTPRTTAPLLEPPSPSSQPAASLAAMAAASPPPAGYTAVPLVHHQHRSLATATTSSPLLTTPAAASSVSSLDHQRALRWQAMGVNVSAILGLASPLVAAPSASTSATTVVGSLFTPMAQQSSQSRQPAAPAEESASASAHRHLLALSRSIEAARQEQHFEPTVKKGGGRGGGGAPFWARKKPNATTPTAAKPSDVQQHQHQHTTASSASPSATVAQPPQKRHRSPPSMRDANEGGAIDDSDEVVDEDLPNEVREYVAEDLDDQEESLEDILAQLESGGECPPPRPGQQQRPPPPASVKTFGKSKSAPPATAAKKSRTAEPKQPRKKAGAAAADSGPKRTLFKIGAASNGILPHGNGASVNSVHHSSAATSAAYGKLNRDVTLEQLLHNVDEVILDPNRIQSLLIGVVTVAIGGHNSFSLAALSSSGGSPSASSLPSPLTSGAVAADRKKLLTLVEGFIILWQEQIIYLSADDGLRFLAELDRNGPRGASDVDIVVWDAASVLLPMLAHQLTTAPKRCAVSPPHPLDVRIMAWMLDPSDACCDFDAVHLRHMPGSRLSPFPMQTLEGVCDRAVQLVALYRRLYAGIGSKGLLQSLLKQERSVTFLCALMKFDGFLVDVAQLDELKARARDATAALHLEALSLVKPHMMEMNLQSPDDCRTALYDVLNLGRYLTADASTTTSEMLTTKGGKLSTAEDVLRRLAPHHRLPAVILEHRKINKILQTYIEGILEGNAVPIPDDDRFCEEVGYKPFDRDNITEFLMHSGEAPEIHRLSTSLSRRETLRIVHATFLQHGTDTGRLSCVDPNLQNLPRIGEVALPPSTGEHTTVSDGGTVAIPALLTSYVRKAFVPLPGCDLVAFDYEQIELRVLAHLSNDAQLVDALGGGDASQGGSGASCHQEVDIHRKIAAIIFRKADPLQVTKEERSQAKRVVFGVLYGMGPRALAAQLNETFERACYIQNAFRQGFPHLDRYHARVVAQCRQDGGVVRTLCGRIRTLSDINDSNQTKRSLAERQAFNTVIQGSAADVVKRAMSSVYDHVLQDVEFEGRIRLHCQVHDELVFSIPREFLHRAVGRIRECMSSCMLLTVPLRVAVQVGPSYGSLTAYKSVE